RQVGFPVGTESMDKRKVGLVGSERKDAQRADQNQNDGEVVLHATFLIRLAEAQCGVPREHALMATHSEREWISCKPFSSIKWRPGWSRTTLPRQLVLSESLSRL